jgi:hypothetical protein
MDFQPQIYIMHHVGDHIAWRAFSDGTREWIVEVIQSKRYQPSHTPILAQLPDIDFDPGVRGRNFVQRRELKKNFHRNMAGLMLWPGFL